MKSGADRVKKVATALAILYVLFLSVFALDAFGGNLSLGKQIIGFIIHLVPSFLLLILIAISRRYPLIGGVMFVLCSIGFTIVFSHDSHFWFQFLLFSLIPFIVGLLYITSFVLDFKAKDQ
jgi:hypothetical protein